MSKDDPLDDASEVLLRQISPNWLADDGVPSSQGFHPWREVDEGCLSVDRGAMTTPIAAFELFTAPRPRGMGASSAGVWGLSVGEVVAQGLAAFADPVPAADTAPANPAHALVDFRDVGPKHWKKVGQRLKVCAALRGALHRSAA